MRSSKLLGALGLALLVAGSIGGVALGEGNVASKPPLVHGSNFQVKTALDETFCLETNAGTHSTGPSVYVKKCDGRPEQRWTLTDGADGTNVIVGNLGMCLAIDHHAASPKPAKISSCNYGKSQRFTVTAAGEIIEVRSGQCLTIGAVVADGKPVFLKPCATPSQAAQLWRLSF